MSIAISAQEFAVLSMVAMGSNDPSLSEGYHIRTTEERVEFELTPEIAALLNGHVINNNKDVYDASPYHEWTKPEDKAKKSIANIGALVTKVGVSDPSKGDKNFSMVSISKSMSDQMAYRVGTGYNIASALVLAALIKTATQQVDAAVVQKAAKVGWEIVYEDLALSQDFKRGGPFYEFLNKCTRGYYSENIDGAWVNWSVEDTLCEIVEIYIRVTGHDLNVEAAAWVLWGFRMARGYGRLKRRGLEGWPSYFSTSFETTCSLFGVRDDGTFISNDLINLTLVGAFRDLGRGAYGVEVEDEAEGLSVSCWEILYQHYDIISSYIPSWLKQKFELAYKVHKAMNWVKLEESRFYETNFTSSFQLPTNLEGVSDSVPAVDVHTANQMEAPFGAFQTTSYHCPIQYVYFVDGQMKQLVSEEQHKSSPEYEFMGHKVDDQGKKVYTTGIAAIPNGCKAYGDALWHMEALSAKKIVQMAADRYPLGVILYSAEGPDEKSQYLDFKGLLAYGAFEGESATGLALAIVELLVGINSNPDTRATGWDRKVRNSIAGLSGRIRSMIGKGIIKRLGRTNRTSFGTKVMTSSAPRVQDARVNGVTLPVVCLNPEDDLVRHSGVKAGDIVGVSRTPMISKFYALVRLDEGVSVGHAEVRASVFKNFTSGDGDGDPCVICMER